MRTRGYQLVLFVGIALALLCGIAVAIRPDLMIGIAAASLIVGVTFMRPQVGIAAWLVFTIVVPSWTLIPAAGTVVGPSYIALPIIAAVLMRRTHDRMQGGRRISITGVDGAVILGVVMVLVYQSYYDQAQFLATNVVVSLFGGYVLGRLSRESNPKVFVVSMIAVAIWGILEFLFGLHPFTEWQVTAGGIGPALQERGGYVRSEASLGHAIAYGACLVAAVPFTRLLNRPLVWQAVLAAGVLVSFSRGPMLALIVTLAVMFYVERSTSRKVASGVVLGVGLVATLIVFDFLYNGSGQAEVASSSYQRDNQIARSLDFINWLGPATGSRLNGEGRYVTNGIEIIDSVPLRLGLDFGWIVVALLLLPVAAASVRVLNRRAGAASIAIVGQIPVLAVTSFITQWQIVFMFVCGLAVNEIAAEKRARTTEKELVSTGA